MEAVKEIAAYEHLRVTEVIPLEAAHAQDFITFEDEINMIFGIGVS